MPAELPQLIPTVLVLVSPNKSGNVSLRHGNSSAAAIYCSHVNYRINTIQMDCCDSKLLYCTGVGLVLTAGSLVYSITVSVFFQFSVIYSNMRLFHSRSDSV